jgi:predicted ArsR family transcriptional regulator
MERDAVRLHNCPFHDIARDNTDLVCGMSLAMMEGIAEVLAPGWLTAELEPAPGRCCVAFHVSDNNRGKSSKGMVIA